MDIIPILFFRMIVGESGFLLRWVSVICRTIVFVLSVQCPAQLRAWPRTPPETFGSQTSTPHFSNCATQSWSNRLPGLILDTKILQAPWWPIVRGAVYGSDSTSEALPISQTIRYANHMQAPMDLAEAASIICASIGTVRFGRPLTVVSAG